LAKDPLVIVMEAKSSLANIKSDYVPPTVQEENMNQFEAAKELRTRVRHLQLTGDIGVNLALAHLEQVLNQSKSKKADRLLALESLKTHLQEQRTAAGKSLSRLQILVQHLPTAAGLPTDVPSNVVRAFVAILKSNGILKQDGTVNL